MACDGSRRSFSMTRMAPGASLRGHYSLPDRRSELPGKAPPAADSDVPRAGLSIAWAAGIIPGMTQHRLISPSILSADFTRLGDILRELEAAGADWVHIDVMDGQFVPNLTMGPFIVEACRRATKLPLDVHLMIETPERLLSAFGEAGADWLTVHVEACPQLHRTLQQIRGLGMKAGVSLNPGTPASALSEVLGTTDLVLVMTVNPGYSGQSFIESVVPKIREIRDMRDRTGSSARIEVDGGVSVKTIGKVAEAGADVLVAASAIFHHPEGIAAGVRALRGALDPAAAGGHSQRPPEGGRRVSRTERDRSQMRPRRLMHLAHSVFWTSRPCSRTRTRCRFGRNMRLVALWEKLRCWPNVVVLPQVAHLAIRGCSFPDIEVAGLRVA